MSLSTSCSFWSARRQSFPYGDGIQGGRHNEKLVLPDLEVHIYSRNAIQVRERTCFTIIPLKIDTDEREVHKRYPFNITVGFLPKMEGFTFNPKEVFLALGEITAIQPVRIFPRIHAEDSKQLAKKWAEEGLVQCGPWPVNAEYVDITDSEITLSDTNLWHCFVFAFDIEAPDPKQEFSVNIKGLKKDGQPYEIPEFRFKEFQFEVLDFAP